jgi:thiamine transporter ThiT
MDFSLLDMFQIKLQIFSVYEFHIINRILYFGSHGLNGISVGAHFKISVNVLACVSFCFGSDQISPT